jgi:hypothetical protein
MTHIDRKHLRVRYIALQQLSATVSQRTSGPDPVGLTSEDTLIFMRLRRWHGPRGGRDYYRNLNA